MRSPTGGTTKSPRAVTVPACQWHCTASVCQCASGLPVGARTRTRPVGWCVEVRSESAGQSNYTQPCMLLASALAIVVTSSSLSSESISSVTAMSKRCLCKLWCSRSRLAESAPRSEDRSAVPGSAVTSARAPACWPSLAQNDCASCSESMRTPSTNASSEEPIEVGMGKQHSAISRRSPDISAKRRHQDIGLKRCCLCKYVDHIAPLPWNSPLLSRSCRASCGISRRHPGCSRSGRR